MGEHVQQRTGRQRQNVTDRDFVVFGHPVRTITNQQWPGGDGSVIDNEGASTRPPTAATGAEIARLASDTKEGGLASGRCC